MIHRQSHQDHHYTCSVGAKDGAWAGARGGAGDDSGAGDVAGSGRIIAVRVTDIMRDMVVFYGTTSRSPSHQQ